MVNRDEKTLLLYALIVILIINIILFFFIENVTYIIAIELPIFTACIIFEIINVQNKLKNNDHDNNNENQD